MSSEIDHGGFAFPTQAICTPAGDVMSSGDDGMTLRDWFAGQAIGAVVRQCATDLQFNGGAQTPEEYFAMKAYAVADAMIAARKVGAE